MKLKQIRVIDTPISISNKKQNEIRIINKLKNFNFVKFVFKEYQQIENVLEKDKYEEEYNDYYYDFSLHNYNGQFKSKHYINKILRNNDFKIYICNNVRYEKIKHLREDWVQGMELRGRTVSNQNTKDFIKITEYNDENLLNIILEYKNVPISIQTFILQRELGFADCLYINHLWKENNIDSDYQLQMVLKNLTDVQNYFASYFLNIYKIKKLYIAGCRPSEKRLLLHKSKITDGVIKYCINNNKDK